MPWSYEPDPRRKHKRGWTSDHPGFVVEEGGEEVGKCPSDMTLERAEALLNDPEAISVRPARWNKPYPKMILNVHNGALYRATWTNPGESCHGFPESPERAEGLPKSVKAQLLELAKRRNCEEEIRKCLIGKT